MQIQIKSLSLKNKVNITGPKWWPWFCTHFCFSLKYVNFLLWYSSVHACLFFFFLSWEGYISVICKKRNWLLHLLSPDGNIRNMLDLSQKVVSEDPELNSDPGNAAAPVSLSDSLRPIMPIGRYRRRSRGPGIGDPSRALSLQPWESHLSLRDSLSSLVEAVA